MWTPTSQSSPSRASAKARCMVACPWRSDLTSLPVSARPASTRSSRWYSCRARRLSAINFSPVVWAIRSILGFDSFGTPAFHPRAGLPVTLASGGGWTELPTQGGEACVCGSIARAVAAAGGRQLDLALVAADVDHAHLQRVAEAMRAAAAPPDQRRPECVQLEVVAGQQSRRHESLEDVPEPHEQPRRDQS